ncbi:DUF1264 domain protein [Blumeria hordei DH14]|uniref:DUF1264 domain protein n=1 Tax=Blumeria graminis f. sp. hordei (strain DH14) TaxID=546991 RepID=N1JBP0_BLUG1|nr:DUF1264 domain protein [Blumeria hordei DH14]
MEIYLSPFCLNFFTQTTNQILHISSETTKGMDGETPKLKDQILETGASSTQSFEPVNSICAHLNAFHVYASNPSRHVEANHYCTHLSADLRQCLIYDTPKNPARLIGIEYMVPKAVYERLDVEERKLWHSHVYEVKSGMLIMPNAIVPETVWDTAETAEMKELVGLYGKTYHFWQVDRGDALPLGTPQLMMSFTADNQIPWETVRNRDERYGIKTEKKRDLRQRIESPEILDDADSCWKGR